MKKCYFCGQTKDLKAIRTDGDEGIENHSSCNKCFFDNELENDSSVTSENWFLYDYNWKKRKVVR